MGKQDCRRAIEFYHEKKRMCQSYDVQCEKCPLYYAIDGFDGEASCKSTKSNQAMVTVVQKWSDMNPEDTRIERFGKLIKGTEFEEAFGYKPVSGALVINTSDEWWNERGIIK